MRILTIFCAVIALHVSFFSYSQSGTYENLTFLDPSLGRNGDDVQIYRSDNASDHARLWIKLGDEYLTDFNIGYRRYQDNNWVQLFSLNGYGNTYIAGKLGIGKSATSKLDIEGGDLQVSNMGHFKGWQVNSLSGLGLDVGISNSMGYVMAYDRTMKKYHKLRLTASGGGNGLTLDTNGNIGIDDTSPEAKLTIDGGDLQVSNMGHFKGWETNNLTGLGLDVGISSNTGYIMAYDRSAHNYHSLRITARGGLNRGIYLNTNGNVGIDTDSPSYKLEVNGTIRSQEVKVEATNWPDYVFEPSYDLKSLEEIEQYIKLEKHLPEIPSAKEMEANGVQLGEMNMLLLKKIEELTLYVLEHEKEIKALKELNYDLIQGIQKLKGNGRSSENN